MARFKNLFTWWNAAPLSTMLYTSSHGTLIGEDEGGNRYYEDANNLGPAGKPRRWVIYNGYADASKVDAAWFGWLHYITDTPPDAETYHAKPWQKAHVENLTGTSGAYHPPGSLARSGKRVRTDDYQPWDAE